MNLEMNSSGRARNLMSRSLIIPVGSMIQLWLILNNRTLDMKEITILKTTTSTRNSMDKSTKMKTTKSTTLKMKAARCLS